MAQSHVALGKRVFTDGEEGEGTSTGAGNNLSAKKNKKQKKNLSETSSAPKRVHDDESVSASSSSASSVDQHSQHKNPKVDEEVTGDIISLDDQQKKNKKNKKNSTSSSNSQSVTSATAVSDGDDTAAFRSLLGISVEGEEEIGVFFAPIKSFDNAPFSPELLKYCAKYSKPSPIQSQCWPIATAGRDVVGIAATGSGKTLAFALPGVMHINSKQGSTKKKVPLMLVLAPTRELACQIDAVCSELGQVANMKTVCIYGGVSKDQQRRALSQGAQIVVATPGRLLDLINEGVCPLDRVSFVVLDEADRMLDLGFEQDIRSIISFITNPQHQTLMFSATWPTSIQTLAKEFLKQPLKVIVGSQDLAASHSVHQIVEVIEHTAKEERLNQLLRDYHKTRKNRVLVFVLYKKEAERIERFLRSRGWNPGSIHGDKNQQDRTAALQSFKDGTKPLLIATDVAARGLDIPNVEYVINVTFPLTIEDYVHRIGRTGRAGASGISHTLFTTFDKSHSGELVNVLKEANQSVPESLLKFGTHTKKKEHKLYGAHFKALDGGETKQPTKITFDDDD